MYWSDISSVCIHYASTFDGGLPGCDCSLMIMSSGPALDILRWITCNVRTDPELNNFPTMMRSVLHTCIWPAEKQIDCIILAPFSAWAYLLWVQSINAPREERLVNTWAQEVCVKVEVKAAKICNDRVELRFYRLQLINERLVQIILIWLLVYNFNYSIHTNH